MTAMADRIAAGAAQMGLSLPEGATEKMDAYWEAVLRVNQTMNLTRIVEPEAACTDHFLDSLAPLLWKDGVLPQRATLLDVGTGAGFPGIPLAFARPDLRVSLLDARRKKILFIEQALEEMGVSGIEAFHARAEETRRQFDVVTARAVTALPALCALLLPLVRPGGTAIMWKGPAADGEIHEAEAACRKYGAKLLPAMPYEIPGSGKDSRLMLAKKSP